MQEMQGFFPNHDKLIWCPASDVYSNNGVLLEYPTTIGFQWGYLKNGPYTYTVSGGNGRVF